MAKNKYPPSPPKQIQVHNNPNYSIFIEHVPTGEQISFDGWVTQFQDQFISSWNSTAVYGRMDDLHTFQRTGRKLSLAFEVLADNQRRAAQNQEDLDRLAQFLYPVYTDSTTNDPRSLNQRVLVAPPLLKLRWANQIENFPDKSGVLGFLNGFTYSPDINQGQFFSDFAAAGHLDPKILNYQQYTVQLEFTVIHTHLTGWSRDSKGAYYFGGKEEDKSAMRDYPRRPGGVFRLLDEVNGMEDTNIWALPGQDKGDLQRSLVQKPPQQIIQSQQNSVLQGGDDDEVYEISMGACHGEHGQQLKDLGMCED